MASVTSTDGREDEMTLREYMQGQREDLPVWLDQFEDGAIFPLQEFFQSRVVYYPGSGTDGHPVKVFGSTHSAHCFVYADSGVTQPALEAKLGHPLHGFQGYHTLSRLQLRETDLVPQGWTSHLHAGEVPQGSDGFGAIAAAPFGFLEILERNWEFDDNHGPRRLAILFLGADGIATYDALFCQKPTGIPPFAVLLQDHGFGGNYNRFGQDGLLEQIAIRCGVFPIFLLVAENTRAWGQFERIPDVESDIGGMHAMPRFLCHRPK